MTVGSRLVAEGGGSQVSVLDASNARSLTDRIKVGLEATWHMVKEAYERRAWVALGYASWDEYCTREFGTSRLRLPREERDEVVASLSSSGMSVRAISAATGMSVGTVQAAKPKRELEASSALSTVQNRTVDSGLTPDKVASLDGRERPAERATRADVLMRQTAAVLLHQSGKTQVEIAAELGVSQPTVSADLSQMGMLVDSRGVVVDAAIVDGLKTAGRLDAIKVAAHLGVDTRPTRDLGRLAKAVCADLTAPAAVIVEKIVLANEWLDVDQRRAACATIVPALTRVVRDFRRAATDIHRPDVDPATWDEWTAALSELGRVADAVAGERVA